MTIRTDTHTGNDEVEIGCTSFESTMALLDGLLEGASEKLYGEILRALPELRLIASGGVSNVEDIRNLEKIGCSGVIIGKAFYEGRIKLEELG